MNFIRQWSDDELNELLLQSDEHFLRPRLQEFVQNVHAQTGHSAEFWERQERAIQQRISSPQKEKAKSLPRLIWAAATVVALAAFLMLQGGYERPNAPPVQVQTDAEADHELLMHVEEAIQSGGPAALEPAAMLAVEIGEHSVPRSDAIPKERTQ